YGTLNARGDNAIMVCTGLTADSHAAGKYSLRDQYPGWWDSLIGSGKAFDTDRYFVICANMLGGCMGSTGPSSIYPITGKPYGMLFPVITVTDMVHAQKKLLDHLGVVELFCVTGGSLGGMQALEWSFLYPSYVRSIIPIACSAHLSAQGIAFNEIGRQTIMADPFWNNGDYYLNKPPVYGLAIARMIGHITYLSEEKLQQRFGRKMVQPDVIREEQADQFEIESYLHYKGHTFVERFDANSYLYLTRALDLYDLLRGQDFESGLASIRTPSLFIAMTSDWLFPAVETKKLQETLEKQGKQSLYREVKSIHGHDGFLIEYDAMTPMIKEFLDSMT
ncbi:MAG: homoserine O-acetyltransferase, partial [Candidatus Margulisiibacteriota bacterium]